MEHRSFYSNIDINSTVTPFLNHAADNSDGRREALYPFVDIFGKTAVTDILLCVFCQYSAVPSEVFTDAVSRFHAVTENGRPVDYSEQYKGIAAWYEIYGIDPYRVWIDRLRETGRNAWLSVRMNDCHCPDDETCFLRSDFFYEARKKGWTVGDRYGYSRYCFDYAVPEVRSRMLRYIREQLFRYFPDGLELDFLREPVCFDYISRKDCAVLMTGFMREVRQAIKEAETECGHRIRLGTRLMRDPKQCLAYGFDAATWSREKLTDLIAVSPRWASCDSDMPISVWKSVCPDTEIAAGVEMLTESEGKRRGTTPEETCGFAVRYLSGGADSMYLFNRFFGLSPLDTDAEHSDDMEISRSCGSLEAASSHSYRYVMTCQDIAPEGYERWKPLPAALSADAIEIKPDPGYIPNGARRVLELVFASVIPALADIRIRGIDMTEYAVWETSSDLTIKEAADRAVCRITLPESGCTAVPVRIAYSGHEPARVTAAAIAVYPGAPYNSRNS